MFIVDFELTQLINIFTVAFDQIFIRWVVAQLKLVLMLSESWSINTFYYQSDLHLVLNVKHGWQVFVKYADKFLYIDRSTF